MKRWWLPCAFAILCQPSSAQVDGCAGAFSALNRVKEQLSPNTSPKKLGELRSTLQDAAHNCPDQPEIMYYRQLVAERLQNQGDLRILKQQFEDLQGDPHFKAFQPSYSNPLTPPPPVVTAPEEPATGLGRKWALVVGLNQFQNAGIPALRFAQKDSSDFAAYLTSAGHFQKDRVKLLLNDQATLQGFRLGLGWLRENVQPSDLVVIYISSHGSPRNMDPNGVSYIIMNDSDPSDAAKLFATSLQMIDLVQQINREIKARRVVLFLDTCFSGDASGAGRQNTEEGAKRIAPISQPNEPATTAFSGALENLKMGVGRAVITASRANEESFENTALHNGYFTAFLLKELKADANKPLGDLFPKVRDQVMKAVSTDHAGKTQTPSCEFSDKAATIILAAPEGENKTAANKAPSGE